MSKKAEEILKLLKGLSGKMVVNVPGKVVSVDESTLTCTVTIDGLDYDEVRLNAVIADENETHSYIIPKAGSWVMVSFIEGSETDGFVCSYSEIDRVVLRATEFVFNDGELGGMVKAQELKAQLDKNNQILSALLTVCTGSPIPEPGNGSPSAFQTALGAALAGKLTGDFSNIENNAILQ
jgi:hydrogenase maturation factor